MNHKHQKDRKAMFFSEKPHRRIYIKYILLLAAVLVVCVLLDRYARDQAVPDADEGSGDYVRVEELAGYLQVIPLTPEETRALIVERLEELDRNPEADGNTDDSSNTENDTAAMLDDSAYLTAPDVEWLFDYLALGEIPDAVSQELSSVGNGSIDRETWSVIYEEILAVLGLGDEVEITDIRYLGMLLDGGHLMADNGNYECDTEGIDFVYGETYRVYVLGNVLLGRAPQGISGEEGTDESGENTDVLPDVTGTELPETVRVLITQDNSGSPYRENLYVKGDCELVISTSKNDVDSEAGEEAAAADENAQTVSAGQIVDCQAWISEKETSEMYLSSAGSTGDSTDGRLSNTDSAGNVLASGYTGMFHIYKDENGLRVVNETSLEAYLCGVVPGEMPKSFSAEALKAQAVCARTYAARLVSEKKYEQYGADLNDTTDCQVYLPSAENEKATEAVHATKRQVLTYEDSFASIYYFSTSCGMTSGTEVWRTESSVYLQTVSLLTDSEFSESVLGGTTSADDFLRRTDVAAYDSHSRYFRWTATLDMENGLADIKAALQTEIDKGAGRVGLEDTSGAGISSIENLGEFSGIEVGKRNTAGVITDLVLNFACGRVHIYHENAIRTVLGKAMTALTDKNGGTANTMTILPSAAFSADMSDGQITLYGGGLGHGIGMSQYGADGMAQAGMGYAEILGDFFPGTELQGDEK